MDFLEAGTPCGWAAEHSRVRSLMRCMCCGSVRTGCTLHSQQHALGTRHSPTRNHQRTGGGNGPAKTGARNPCFAWIHHAALLTHRAPADARQCSQLCCLVCVQQSCEHRLGLSPVSRQCCLACLLCPVVQLTCGCLAIPHDGSSGARLEQGLLVCLTPGPPGTKHWARLGVTCHWYTPPARNEARKLRRRVCVMS